MSKRKNKPKFFLQNDILRESIFQIWSSVSEFAHLYGFSQKIVGDLINLKRSPIHKTTGDFTKTAQKLACVLGFSCDELFRLDLYNLAHLRPSLVSYDELMEYDTVDELFLQFENPESLLLKNEEKRKVRKLLDCLAPKAERIIRHLYGVGERCVSTPELIAHNQGWTVERVKKTEERVLRKLRHPTRCSYWLPQKTDQDDLQAVDRQGLMRRDQYYRFVEKKLLPYGIPDQAEVDKFCEVMADLHLAPKQICECGQIIIFTRVRTEVDCPQCKKKWKLVMSVESVS